MMVLATSVTAPTPRQEPRAPEGSVRLGTTLNLWRQARPLSSTPASPGKQETETRAAPRSRSAFRKPQFPFLEAGSDFTERMLTQPDIQTAMPAHLYSTKPF